MQEKNIILIGMMGSGKSTVGQVLAKHLNLNFIDLDIELEKHFQKSISEIFKEFGEKAFRKAETQILKQIKVQAVISTGGGIVLKPKNRELLKSLGLVVWLKASTQTIFERLKDDQARPLLKTSNEEPDKLIKIQKILEERENLYSEIAHLIIETNNLNPLEVQQIILQKLI